MKKLLHALLLALTVLSGCIVDGGGSGRMFRWYLKATSDHGPNTMFGAPVGSHYVTQSGDDDEIGHGDFGHGAIDQATALDSDNLQGDLAGEIETYDLSAAPGDLDECTQIVPRLCMETSGFAGVGGTIDIPCKIYKADATLLGTSLVTIANDDDGLETEPPFFTVFEGSAITGLSLSKADVDGLYWSFEVPSTGFTGGALLRVFASDLEITYTASVTDETLGFSSLLVIDSENVAATIEATSEFDVPVETTHTFSATIHAESVFDALIDAVHVSDVTVSDKKGPIPGQE